VGEGGGREIENGRGMARAGAGGVNGSRRPALAAMGRALVTRGRRRGHAVRVLYRWSATDGFDSVRSVNRN